MATRTWTAVAVVGDDVAGFRVTLDGRDMLLPDGTPLRLPDRALAEAVAAEWAAAGGGKGGRYGLDALPLTRLAATELVQVRADREEALAALLRGADSDMLCYRAGSPAPLARRQEALWQPVLDRLASETGARMRVAEGVMPFEQDPATVARLRATLERAEDAALAGLLAAVPAVGSLALGLGLVAGHVAPEAAARLALLDAAWEAERWGEAGEVEARIASLARTLGAVRRYLELRAGARAAGAVRLLIRGRVQGVGYREWLVREAARRRIAGWVRNLASGEVEAVASGHPDAVAALREACRRGPPAARVEMIEETPHTGPVAPGFARLPTA